MKERQPISQTLARSAQNTYPKSVGIFMDNNNTEVQGAVVRHSGHQRNIGSTIPLSPHETQRLRHSPQPRVVSGEELNSLTEEYIKNYAELNNRDPDTITFEERQALRGMAERGHPLAQGGGSPDIDAAGIVNDQLRREIELTNRKSRALRGDTIEVLMEGMERVARLEQVPEGERQQLLNRYEEALANVRQREIRQREEEQRHREAAVRRRGEYEIEERAREILERPDVQRALRDEEHPDFNHEALRELTEYINGLTPADTNAFLGFAHHIAGLRHRDNPQGPKEISEEAKKVILERLLETIVSRPDVTPDAHYDIGSYQIRDALDKITELTRTAFSEDQDAKFYAYIKELAHVREMAHELNRNFKHGETYKKFLIEGLNAEGLDFMHNELAGVSKVIRAYEKITAQKVAEQREWLSAADIYNIDQEVKQVAEKMHGVGHMMKDGRKLTDWEVRRALRIGKILFSGSQRMAMYAVQGDLPPDFDVAGRISSIPLEFIARALVPLKITAARFFTDPGPRRFMELIAKEIEEAEKSEYVGLFGIDKKTMMFNNNGIYDPESHSWRTQLLFLSNVKIHIASDVTVKGERTGALRGEWTLDKYLMEVARLYVGATDPLFGRGEVKDKKGFSHDVEDFILGQRLYLSVLAARYGNFDNDLKAKIWQKIASLKPSTIVSLLPKEALQEGEKQAWDRLKEKLYIAEEMRVERDTQRYQDEERPLTERELRSEAERFRRGEMKYEIFNYFSERLELDEEQLLRRIIDRGYDHAQTLAGAVMPFTYCIDDVPRVSWAKTQKGYAGADQSDLLRLLYGDQDTLSKGWAEINALIESPVQGAVEHFAKAVDGYAGVHGRQTAQEKLEPFMVAYLNFLSTKEWINWFPMAKTARRLFRDPTSEIEEYYKQSFLSLDEEEKADFITALAQAKAISDRAVGPGEQSQLDRIRKKTKSNRFSLFLRWIRIITYLLGPETAYQLFKAVAPEDVTKNLQLK